MGAKQFHAEPDHALTDGSRSITPEVFGKTMSAVAAITEAVGREV